MRRHARPCAGHPRLVFGRQQRRGWPGQARPGTDWHRPGHDGVGTSGALTNPLARVDRRIAQEYNVLPCRPERRHISFTAGRGAGAPMTSVRTSHLLPTYARVDLAFERGEGAWLIAT